jgi:hypothetical protein
MREKLAILEPAAASPAGELHPDAAIIAGSAGDAGCPRCLAELVAAGEAFDQAFADRDFEGFRSWFYDENATGLGADGTVGMNRDSWARILQEYFAEPTWTLHVTPIKAVVQSCVSGQILEIVHFDSAAQQITFVHVTCWLRRHGEWKVVLQTEAGPVPDGAAVLAQLANESVAP